MGAGLTMSFHFQSAKAGSEPEILKLKRQSGSDLGIKSKRQSGSEL